MSDTFIQFAGLAACLTLKNLAWMSVSRRAKRPVARVEKVVIYPVKSCRGIEVEAADIDVSGLRCGEIRDRCYAVVSSNDMRYISLKTEVTLNRVVPALEPEGGISLTAEGHRRIRVRHCGPRVNFHVRADLVSGIDCGDEVAEWLSEVCERPDLRLVYGGQSTGRWVGSRLKMMDLKGGAVYEEAFAAACEKPDTEMNLIDKTPILLLSEKSLQALNSKLNGEHPGVDWRNFRPNLLVSGVSEDRAEDSWGFMFVGSCVLAGIFPCERCMMVNIDYLSHSEAKMTPGMPVLKALSQYRSMPMYKNPLFGVQCTVHRTGRVSVGDSVLVDA